MDHAPGFSGACTRLQRCAWGWCARALGHVWLSRKIPGNSQARRKILGVTGREFRENLGFLHHQTASFVGAPITTRERCHVTQPRARINVSCSRAGLGGPQKGCCEGYEEWVPDLGAGPRCQSKGASPRRGRNRTGKSGCRTRETRQRRGPPRSCYANGIMIKAMPFTPGLREKQQREVITPGSI